MQLKDLTAHGRHEAVREVLVSVPDEIATPHEIDRKPAEMKRPARVEQAAGEIFRKGLLLTDPQHRLPSQNGT